MKAKVITTGKIVNVELFYKKKNSKEQNIYNEVGTLRQFMEDNLVFVEEEKIDWEQRRFELVKQLLPEIMYQYKEDNTFESVLNTVLSYADAVIAKLKEE